MLPTPPASQVSTDALHDRMNDPAEDQNVINTTAQQGRPMSSLHAMDEDQCHQATINDSEATSYNAKQRNNQRKKAKSKTKQNIKKAERRKQAYHNNRIHEKK